MTPVAIGLTIVAVCMSCLGIMWWFAMNAPRGCEDRDGFRYGDKHSHDDNLGI